MICPRGAALDGLTRERVGHMRRAVGEPTSSSVSTAATISPARQRQVHTAEGFDPHGAALVDPAYDRGRDDRFPAWSLSPAAGPHIR